MVKLYKVDFRKKKLIEKKEITNHDFFKEKTTKVLKNIKDDKLKKAIEKLFNKYNLIMMNNKKDVYFINYFDRLINIINNIIDAKNEIYLNHLINKKNKLISDLRRYLTFQYDLKRRDLLLDYIYDLIFDIDNYLNIRNIFIQQLYDEIKILKYYRFKDKNAYHFLSILPYLTVEEKEYLNRFLKPEHIDVVLKLFNKVNNYKKLKILLLDNLIELVRENTFEKVKVLDEIDKIDNYLKLNFANKKDDILVYIFTNLNYKILKKRINYVYDLLIDNDYERLKTMLLILKLETKCYQYNLKHNVYFDYMISYFNFYHDLFKDYNLFFLSKVFEKYKNEIFSAAPNYFLNVITNILNEL